MKTAKKVKLLWSQLSAMSKLTIDFARLSKIYRKLMSIDLLVTPYSLTNSEIIFHHLVTTCRIRASMKNMRRIALKMGSLVSKSLCTETSQTQTKKLSIST